MFGFTRAAERGAKCDLYVLSNKDKSKSKVGITCKGTPSRRAIDYSREHPEHGPWEPVWSKRTRCAAKAERLAHTSLAKERVTTKTGAKEIFAVKPAKAVKVAKRHERRECGCWLLPSF